MTLRTRIAACGLCFALCTAAVAQQGLLPLVPVGAARGHAADRSAVGQQSQKAAISADEHGEEASAQGADEQREEASAHVADERSEEASAQGADERSEEAGTPLTLPQARALAVQALSHGDTRLVLQLAAGLLQANPNDAQAHFLIAAAQARAGQHTAARKAAGRAYRASDAPRARVQAAQLAARAAFDEDRPTLTQIWLRRAALNTDDEASQNRIAADYARVRAINPLSVRIGGGIRPSDNINNGTDNTLETVDGVPTSAFVQGPSRALPGTIATLDVDLRYRLRATETSQTALVSRLYIKRAAMNDEAKALVRGPGALPPYVRNSDFGSTVAQLGVRHRFALGAKGNSAMVGLVAGQSWSGGDRLYDTLRFELGRSVKLGDAARLTLSAAVEQRWSTVSDVRDITQWSGSASYTVKRPGGDILGLSYTLTDTVTDYQRSRATGHSLRASYTFAKSLGPAQVSLSATYANTEFPEFFFFELVPPFFLTRVDRARQDHAVYGDLTLFFKDYDYAGFAPSVRLRVGGRNSNYSLYENRETSVDFQIRSTF
ncbi:MAG: hypothetical protein AAFN94_11085 [Pseudomonadota bacterium]